MAAGVELGAAWLSILPDMSKVGGLVSKGMSAAGAVGAKAFTASAKKEVGGLAKAFGEVGKDAGELLAKQALAAAKSDISKLSKQMATATDAQANAVGRLRVAQAKLDEVRANSKAKASQIAVAEEAVAAATRKATVATDAAKSVTDKLTAAQERGKKAADDVAKAQADAAAQAGKSGDKAGNAFTSAFKSGFRPQEAASQLNKIDGKREGKGLAARFGVGFNGAFGGIISKSVGLLAATIATVGIGHLGVDAVNLEANFSQTMNTMAAVAKVPASEIKNLSDLALKMGADTTFSAGEAGGAMLELAKGGLSAATIQSGALEGTLTLAAAGGTDLATASTIASNALNTFQLKGKDMASVAAALAGGANASSASVESLGEALSQVGPGATIAGLTLQDTVGVLSAFDAAGIKGSDAGTSLKTMLTRLVPSTDKAAGAMDELGLKFTDAHGTFLPITNIAQQLKDKLSGLSDEQQTTALSTIFGSDATRAATVLMKEGTAGISKYITATKDQNAANEVAAARMSGTAGAIESFKGSIETAKLQLGQFLAPAVQSGLKLVTDGVNGIAPAFKSAAGAVASSGIAPAFKEVTGGFRALVASFKAGDGDITSSGLPGFMERLGFTARQVFEGMKNDVIPFVVGFASNLKDELLPPVITIGEHLWSLANVLVTAVGPAVLSFSGFLGDNATLIQSVAVGVTAMVIAFKAYQGALALVTIVGKGVVAFTKAWTAAQALLNAVMNANVFALIALAVIGLAVGLKYAWDHSETFRKVVTAAFNGVKSVALTVFNAIKTAVTTAIDFVGNHWKLILGIIGGPLIAAVLLVVTYWDQIKSAIGTAVGAVVGVLKTVWGGITAVLMAPINAFLAGLRLVWPYIGPILVLPFYIANAAITGVWNLIKAGFTAAKDWVVGTFSKAWAVTVAILSGPLNEAKRQIDVTWSLIKAAFNVAKSFVLGAFAVAWATVNTVIVRPITAAKDWIARKFAETKAIFLVLKDYVVGSFARAWAVVSQKLSGPIDDAKRIVSTALGAAKGGIQWVFVQAVKGVGKIWDGLQELAKKPIRFIVNTVLNDGLIGAFNWIAGKFKAPEIPRINLPDGFESGGQYTGKLPGRKSSTDNMLGWTPKGAVGLATGEFIVNAEDTARTLPFLEHVNNGGEIPGLGFADGGLFGKLKSGIVGAFNAGKSFGQDVLTFLKNPVAWIKDRLSGPLGRMSELGDSPAAQIVKTVPRNLIDAVSAKAKDLLSGTGGVFNPGLAGALDWAKTQVGQPYVWGGVGPHGYDCSGFMSAIVNVIRGSNPFQRLFATGSLPAGMFAPGPGAFELGWFQGNPGHVAGTLNGTNVESRGGAGVLVGPQARGAHDGLFNQHGHLVGYANGGIVGDAPFDELDPRGKSYKAKAILPRSALSFDSGGLLPTGYSIAHNGTGRPEPVGHDVLRKGDLDGMHVVLDIEGVGKLNAHIDTRASKVHARKAASLVHEYDLR